MKYSKLIFKNKIILENMKLASSIFEISRGLMFASKKRIERGICLKMPLKNNSRLSCAITMLFCFYPMHILFLDSKFKVVDIIILKPFKISYIPKHKCKYVIESTADKFNNLKFGDILKIENTSKL